MVLDVISLAWRLYCAPLIIQPSHLSYSEHNDVNDSDRDDVNHANEADNGSDAGKDDLTKTKQRLQDAQKFFPPTLLVYRLR